MNTYVKAKYFILAIVAIASASIMISSACCCSPVQLTAEQRTKLKQMATDIRNESMQFKNASREARKELNNCYDSYSLNESAIESDIQKLTHTQLQLLYTHLKMQLSFRKIITRDQFESFTSNFKGRPDFNHKRPFIIRSDMDILKQSGLSNNQLKKLSSLVNLENKVKSIIRNISDKSRNLRNLYMSYDLDESAAKKQINSINRLQEQISNVMYRKQILLRTILTKEQLQTYRAKRKRIVDQHFGGPNNHNGHGWQSPPSSNMPSPR